MPYRNSSRNYNNNSNSNSNYSRSSYANDNSNSNSNSNNRSSHSNNNSRKEEAKKPGSPKYYEGETDWEVLGIPKDSDPSTVKKAYVKLVSKWHPDKVKDTSNDQQVKEAHKRTQRINAAYAAEYAAAIKRKEGGKSRKHHKKRRTVKNKH
jgi:hypothetical protein